VTRYLSTAHRGASATELRLFCFPFAGGGATAYLGWQRALGPAVRVMPVHLPGREGRMSEPRFTDLGALTADLDEQLDAELDGPHLFFGHSMGALIAFNLALRRFERGRPLPRALVLAGYRAPHLGPPRFGDRRLPDAELIGLLSALGGIPEPMLRHPQWLNLLLPIVRDDLLLCSKASVRGRRPLPVPIHVFAGSDDPLAVPAEMDEWAGHTARDFELRVLPGRHFFIREREADFLDQLSHLVRRYRESDKRPARAA
jgi:surfactin synthase thioesterase subunit